MQQKRERPALQRGRVSDNARLSISGASTASHDTTTPQDSLFVPDARYAPIRPQSRHSIPADHNRATGLMEISLNDHPGMEHIHQYNNSQPHAIDPQLGRLNGDDGAQREIDHRGAHSAVETLISAAQQVPSRQGSQAPGATEGGEKKEKRNAGATAANERELRQLIDENKHRTLDSIARDVRNAERTQRSERYKQLFAMRWLREYCKQDKESVPRNRVYTNYAQRCGTERVDTLNPASFGKLVRVIFPGIATRRLGVRGESKYHYVNLTLVGDPHRSRQNKNDAQVEFTDRETPIEPEQSFATNPPHRNAVDSSVFPRNDYLFDLTAAHLPSDGTNLPSQSRIFADQNPSSFRHEGSRPQLFTQNLKFSSKDQASLQNEPLALPDIHGYLSKGTDPELADSLTASYRSHCTSLIDAVRYVKEKQFTRLLSAFNGTMTTPVARIFNQPSLGPWIKSCDLLMYQQIIRFVSQLALQVIPSQVFSMLRSVSRDLTDHIRKNFRQYPEHVMQAKLEPATIFARLLQRLLRVNETAHAAANMLMSDDLRNMMWEDWVRNVRPKRVIESALSTCGHEEAYYILTSDVRTLLEPLGPSDWIEQDTEFQRLPHMELRRATALFAPEQGSLNADNIVERWALFLNTIPSRFPEAQTRTLLHCMDSIGSAVLRDITVNQGPSFGVWWVTKVWMDEMMLWMAESGGFLEAQGITASPAEESPQDTFQNWLEGSQQRRDSRASASRPESSAGLGIDFQFPAPGNAAESGGESAGPEPVAAPTFKFPTTTTTTTTMTAALAQPQSNENAHHNDLASKPDSSIFDALNDSHDDSGIGMSLLTDSGPPEAFEKQQRHQEIAKEGPVPGTFGTVVTTVAR